MAFTSGFALFAFAILAIVFGITYKRKGLIHALIATGIALVVLAALFAATIYAIVSVMPN